MKFDIEGIFDDPIADAIGAENAGLIPVLIEQKNSFHDKKRIKIKKLSEIFNFLS